MTEAQWLACDDVSAMMRWLKDAPRRRPGDRKLRLFACACARQAWGLLPRADLKEAVVYGEEFADDVSDRMETGKYDAGKAAGLSVEQRAAWLVALCCTRPGVGTFSLDWPGQIGIAAKALIGARAADLLRDVVGDPYRPVTLPHGPTEVRCDKCGRANPAVTFADMRCLGCGRGIARVQPGPCPWLTPTVLSLAHAAYDERLMQWQTCPQCEGESVGKLLACRTCGNRAKGVEVDTGTLDPARLAILADALEEAGCYEDCADCRQQRQERAEYNARPDVIPDLWPTICVACGGKGSVPSRILGHLRSPGPHARGCWAVDCLLGRD